MSIRVMSWVWENSRAEGTDRLVLLAIADSASDDGDNAWPSVATLANKAKVSVRTVQRSVKALTLLGEVEVTANAGRHGSNVYRVKMTPRQIDTPVNLTPVTVAPRQPVGGDTAVTGGVTPVTPRGDTGVTRTVLNRPVRPLSTTPASTSDPRFVEFWATYPRRAGKPEAFRAFVKAMKRASAEKIIDGARVYRDDPNRDDQYTAHPGTWLNRDGWDDDPIPSRGATRRTDDPAGWAR